MFTVGHCVGHCWGTVGALLGHCWGTVGQLQFVAISALDTLIRLLGAMVSLVRRRLSKKSPDPQFVAQEPTLTPNELDSETVGAKRQVYLVTFPYPRPGGGLVAPASLTRADLMQKLLQACNAPAGNCPHRPHRPIGLDCAAVFHELHNESADGVACGHYHVAVRRGAARRGAARRGAARRG